MDRPSFEQLIKEDRAARESKVWRGPFLEYLDLVREDPSLPKLSHARIFDNIMRSGTLDIQESDDPRVKRLYKDETFKVFNFFRDEFFGIEKTVAQIVRYFHSASLKGEESRQVLYLMGPVGSGKSSLVERLQRGLEASEPFYAIENCPMAEEPLHLIPRHLRKEFEKMLGVHIEGDLCPVCRFRLKEEYGGRYEEVPVSTRFFSKRNRIGIGVVPPVDPNNQDTSVLIGSEDISKLDMYSEGDPRVLDLNGAPHPLEIASMFAILSRLEPNAKCDLVTKLKLYNGEEVVEKGKTKKIDIQELREDAKREGMNGISTRFIMKALDNALSDNVEGNCINPINVREALISMVKEADLPDDTLKQHLEFLQDVLHKEHLVLLEKEITKAFVYSS